MMKQERHVLVSLAHPDDETFGCGGTIALYTQAGVPVTYICGTKGEMGRSMGRPVTATRESLPAIRERELLEAMRILGVKDTRFLGLWDKLVEFVDPEVLAGRIKAIIEELSPSLVITFHPEFGGHPDHCAIGRATIRAVQLLPADQRPVVHVKAPRAPKSLGEPQYHDISSVLELKNQAIAAHASQSGPMSVFWEKRYQEASPEERVEIERNRKRESYWVYPV
jgi:bacillithiol biosynthesis deacetylase BshB2